jgi:glycosyltransferase involved in cell wall biosynthesis
MTASKLLFFIDGLGAGGAERQLLYLLARLDREKYAPEVLTLYDNRGARYHYAHELSVLRIPCHSLNAGFGGKERIRACIKYIHFLWQYRPHLVQGWLHNANLIARLARCACPPHVLLTSERLVFTPRGLRSEQLTYWLDNLMTVNSPHIYRQVQEYTRRPGNRLALIPNAVPVDRFTHNTDATLRTRLFPDSSFVIGIIGRIAQQKDHMTFLRALHLCRSAWPTNLAVFFLGEASEPTTLQVVKRFIEEYELNDTVHLLPVTNDVVPYYHAADVIVLPSLAEGFPNVVLEAFAVGKTVIASTDADGPGIIQEGQTGWHFPTGNAEALAACLLERWQISHEQLEHMQDQAQTQVKSYTIVEMAVAYMRLYETLLTNNG